MQSCIRLGDGQSFQVVKSDRNLRKDKVAHPASMARCPFRQCGESKHFRIVSRAHRNVERACHLPWSLSS